MWDEDEYETPSRVSLRHGYDDSFDDSMELGESGRPRPQNCGLLKLGNAAGGRLGLNGTVLSLRLFCGRGLPDSHISRLTPTCRQNERHATA
jgi:hypothetical protein